MDKITQAAVANVQRIAANTDAPAVMIADALLRLNTLGRRARRRAWVRINDWSLFADGSHSRWMPKAGEPLG